MKSLKVLLLVLAICCFPLFGKVYKVGMGFNYPPVSFIDQNGKMAGFEVDLIKEIAKAANIKIEIVNTDFNKIFDDIYANKIDFAISYIGITPERLQKFDFSHAYYKSKSCFYTLYKSDIKTIEDFKGKKIAVASAGSTQEKLAKELSDQVVVFDNVIDVINALKTKKVDAMIIDNINIPLAIYGYQFGFDEKELEKKIAPYKDIYLNLIATKELEDGVAILFKKGTELNFISKINEAIKYIENDGIKSQLLLETMMQ